MLNATFICCLYDMMKHHGFGRSSQIYFQGPNLLKSLAYEYMILILHTCPRAAPVRLFSEI